MKALLAALVALTSASAFAETNYERMLRRQIERGVVQEPVVYKKPVGKIVPISAYNRMIQRQIERGVIQEPVVYKKPVGKIVPISASERMRLRQIERGVIQP